MPDNQNRRLVETGYDSYYRDDNNQYYLRKDSDGNSEYIPVDCVFVDYGNESSILQIMNSDYGNEFKESVWRDYELYLSLPDNEKFLGVAFIERYDAKDYGKSGTRDYIYNPDGTYRSIEYIVYNYSTGWQYLKQGTGTRNAITNIAQVAATIFASGSSYASTAVNYFLTGITIVNAFKSFYNLGASYVIPTNASDYFQARLVFDKYTRYVHRKMTSTSWETCLVLNKATVKKIGQETYFAGTGEAPYTSDRTVNQTYTCDHYYNYWAYATNFNGDTTYYEYLRFQCCGHTWLIRN